MSALIETIECFLIDDDPDDQEIFAMALEKVNPEIKVVFAKDGIDALVQLNDPLFTPRLIFIDINMPRMNGIHCLTELKKIDRLRNVPTFVYSTFNNPQMISETLRLHATDYIIKPPSISLLYDILKKIIK